MRLSKIFDNFLSRDECTGVEDYECDMGKGAGFEGDKYQNKYGNCNWGEKMTALLAYLES